MVTVMADFFIFFGALYHLNKKGIFFFKIIDNARNLSEREKNTKKNFLLFSSPRHFLDGCP